VCTCPCCCDDPEMLRRWKSLLERQLEIINERLEHLQ
jgi:hypothetical protein